jgi:hypothetical protein
VSCAHRLAPLAVQPFQQRRGAVWVMDYCEKCGERHWHVRSPEPLIEEQPRP